MTEFSVIVTGASSGIGRQTAIDLASAGVTVLAIGRRKGLLQELVQANPEKIHAMTEDITDPQAAGRISSEASKFQGRLGLVNAAGVGYFGDFQHMDFGLIQTQMETNLFAPMRLIHQLLPQLISVKGHIVNVLSITTNVVLANSEAYSASKSGLLAFGRSLSQSYRKQGLRVTSISPGAIDTPIWDKVDNPPDRKAMLSTSSVSNLIRDVLLSPPDRSFDEITLSPPNGIL